MQKAFNFINGFSPECLKELKKKANVSSISKDYSVEIKRLCHDIEALKKVNLIDFSLSDEFSKLNETFQEHQTILPEYARIVEKFNSWLPNQADAVVDETNYKIILQQLTFIKGQMDLISNMKKELENAIEISSSWSKYNAKDNSAIIKAIKMKLN